MQAWQVYLDELKARTPNGAAPLGQRELLHEAVHDAYQRAADRMTREYGWEDEHTLVVMRGLNAAVKEWIDRGSQDWDKLSRHLQHREFELTRGFAPAHESHS